MLQQLVPLGFRWLRNIPENASVRLGLWASSPMLRIGAQKRIAMIDMGGLGSFQTIDARRAWRVCELTLRRP
jgi:hypothetical protein